MISLDKKRVISAAIGCAACLLVLGMFALGFFIGKRVYDVPVDTEIKRDTVTRWDTIPHWYPKPVEVEKVRTEYQWLPLAKIAHDTIGITKIVHDSVLVEVPITSKHYNSPEYDAWVSGYLPNLDSIMVYQKEVTITEVRTISKPPNKWELDIVGGIDYNTASQRYTPYALGELMYKPNRLQVGLQGGVIKLDKVEPVIGGKIKIRIL